MICFRRWTWRFAALALLLVQPGQFAQGQDGSDPLDDLRRAVEKGENLPVLQKHAARIKTIPDLMEAVQIRLLITSTDKGQRELLEKDLRAPLKKLIKKVVSEGDEVSKLAVAARLGTMEIGAVVFGVGNPEGAEQYRTFLQSLAGELQALILAENSTPKVRAAAALSLGNMVVEPAKAVAALKTLLASQRSPAENRAGAEALPRLVQRYDLLLRKAPGGSEIVTLEDVLTVCKESIPAAQLGLQRPDAIVRGHALQAYVHVCQLLDSDSLLRVPPKNVDAETVLAEEKQLKPLLDVMNQAIKDAAFTEILSSGTPPQRLQCLRVLEHLGAVRLRLNLRREFVNQPLLTKEQDPLLSSLQKSVKHISMSLQDPNPDIRLAATEFLERIVEAGSVSVEELAARLKDSYTFVRWSAVRALGRLGVVELQPLAKKTPGPFTEEPLRSVVLTLGNALAEKDLDVRITVADNLALLAVTAGSAKEAADRDKALAVIRLAVPSLVLAAQSGDGDGRVAVLRALGHTGVTAAQAPQATQALVGVLQHPVPKVRQVAAETLGSFGALASGASTALQSLLDDEFENVRRAASDALLKIKKQ